MERLHKIGELRPLHSSEVSESRLGIGFEKLDRDAFDPEKAYDRVAETGVKWVRIQSGWNKTEPEKGVYHFEWLDAIVDNLVRRGLRPWICLCYGNAAHDDLAKQHYGAVGCAPNRTPEMKQAWHDYVVRTVARYKDRVHDWEIWNEPDGQWCWKTGPSGTEYGLFAVDTARAIREADPGAYIIGGVVCQKLLGYLNDAFLAGMGDWIDAVSFHEYTADESSVPDTVRVYKAIADMYNDKIEIVQGETGSQSRRGGHGAVNTGSWTPVKQAKQLLRHAVIDLNSGCRFSSYFSCLDMKEALNGVPGDASSYTDFGYFGILGADFDAEGHATGDYTPKPSFYALQNLAALLAGKLEHKPLPVVVYPIYSDLTYVHEPDSHAVEQASFIKGDLELFLYWKRTDLMCETYDGTCTLKLVSNKPIHLIDPMDGSVYELPESIVRSGELNFSSHGQVWREGSAYTLQNLPIRDYPLAIAFGDVSGMMK